MDTRPSSERIAKWRAEYAADLDKLKEQALEDFDRRWSNDDNESSQIAVAPQVESIAPPTRSVVSANGSSVKSSRTPTMKQMISKVLPEPGETFTSRDIRTAVLNRWPEASTKHIGSRISQVLKKSADTGKLDNLGKGDRVQDPITYRVKEGNGETLLSP